MNRVVLGNLWIACTLLVAACGGSLEGGESGNDAGTSSGDGGGSGGGTPADKFTAWMNCMRFDDFRIANFATAWNIGAENNQNCVVCHENGAEGFIVTTNQQKFFDAIKTNKYYALEFFTYTQLTPFKVTANSVAMTGVSSGQDPHREHPRFIPNPGIAASADLAKQTQIRFEAANGNCTP